MYIYVCMYVCIFNDIFNDICWSGGAKPTRDMFSLTPPHRSRIHPRMGAVLKILISETFSVSVTLESWKSWKTQNTSKSGRTGEGGFS